MPFNRPLNQLLADSPGFRIKSDQVAAAQASAAAGAVAAVVPAVAAAAAAAVVIDVASLCGVLWRDSMMFAMQISNLVIFIRRLNP